MYKKTNRFFLFLFVNMNVKRDVDEGATLDDIVQFVSLVVISVIVFNARVIRYQAVLGSNVECVVDLPIYFTDLASRMEQTLKDVLEYSRRTECHSQTFNGIHDGVDNVRTIVEQKE